LPLVVGTEASYKNHDAFDTLAIPNTYFTRFLPRGAPSAIVHSDLLLWLFALDVISVDARWLTSTGNVKANFELNGTTILSYNDLMNTAGHFERLYHNNVNLLFDIDTSWWWSAITPGWTSIYNPNRQTWLLFPSCVFMPPWTNKLLHEASVDRNPGLEQVRPGWSAFKGKSMLIAQFQYNFSIFQR
jgi:hypothetical protein